MSQADKIFEVLNKHPGEWFPMNYLCFQSKSYNIATRVSVDLNRKRGPREGWHIENKVEQVGQEKHSFYRLVYADKEREVA